MSDTPKPDEEDAAPVDALLRIWRHNVKNRIRPVVDGNLRGHIVTLRQVGRRAVDMPSPDGKETQPLYFDLYEFDSGNTPRDSTPQGWHVLMTEEVFVQLVNEVAEYRSKEG